jgi:hypothetical protein
MLGGRADCRKFVMPEEEDRVEGIFLLKKSRRNLRLPFHEHADDSYCLGGWER